jgi:hypothetical protein
MNTEQNSRYAGQQSKYTEKYVLFFDVLGWSSLMTDSEDGFIKAKKVTDCLAAVFQQGCKNVLDSDGHPATPRYEFFSDSMIVTIPYIGGETYWPEEVAFGICRQISLGKLIVTDHGFAISAKVNSETN